MQIYVQESRECCSLDIPVHKLVKLVIDAVPKKLVIDAIPKKLVIDAVPNMAGMNTVVSSLIPIM
jgi:hypothetical protein